MKKKDLKKLSANEALKYIKENMIIGLGGGRSISYLIEYIREENINVKIVTPSMKTKAICLEKGLEVLHTEFVDKIDVAFDGCDQVDKSLNALKSNGGIHTKEKIIASMAEEYILLVDEEKFVDKLTFEIPVVLEVVCDSLKLVENKIRALNGEPKVRCSENKDGFTVTDNGNILIDVLFKEVDDIRELNKKIISICGVIETSLFTNEVTKVLVASENEIKIIEKS